MSKEEVIRYLLGRRALYVDKPEVLGVIDEIIMAFEIYFAGRKGKLFETALLSEASFVYEP